MKHKIYTHSDTRYVCVSVCLHSLSTFMVAALSLHPVVY